MPELHSDAWWMRVYEDDLSPSEEQMWQAHLSECETCRLEWGAMSELETLLHSAPQSPPLPVDFTERTVAKVQRQRRIRWFLSFIAALLIITLVTVVEIALFGSAIASVDRGVTVVLSGRQLLFGALMRTLLSLFVSWKTVVPMVLALCAVGLAITMPNGILATGAFIWLSRRRRAPDTTH